MIRFLLVLFGLVNATPKLTEEMIRTLQSFRLSPKSIDILKRYSQNGCPKECSNAAQLDKIFGLNSASRKVREKMRKKVWLEFHPDKIGRYLEGDLAILVSDFAAGFVQSTDQFCRAETTDSTTTSLQEEDTARRNARDTERRESQRRDQEREETFRREMREAEEMRKRQMQEEEEEERINKEEERKRQEQQESRRRQMDQNNQESRRRQELFKEEQAKKKRELDEMRANINKKREEQEESRKLQEEEARQKQEQQQREDVEAPETTEQTRMRLNEELEAQRLADEKVINEAGEKAAKEGLERRQSIKKKQEQENTSGAEPSMMTKVLNELSNTQRRFNSEMDRMRQALERELFSLLSQSSQREQLFHELSD